MNPLQAEKLVTAYCHEGTRDERVGIADQMNAALKDQHGQLLVFDAMFRRAAMELCRQSPPDFDVHADGVNLAIPEDLDGPRVAEVINTLVSYICGDPTIIGKEFGKLICANHDSGDAMIEVLFSLTYALANGHVPIGRNDEG